MHCRPITVLSGEREGARSERDPHFALDGSVCERIERSSIIPTYLPSFVTMTGSPVREISFIARETGSDASRMLGFSISITTPLKIQYRPNFRRKFSSTGMQFQYNPKSQI